MPTPACLAIALRDALPEALPEALLEVANASRAAVRMRSRLVRASFLDGFWFTGDACVRPVGLAACGCGCGWGQYAERQSEGVQRGCKSGGVSGTLASVTEGSPFYCDTGGGPSWPSWFWLPGAAATSPAGASPNSCAAATRCARQCGIRAGK